MPTLIIRRRRLGSDAIYKIIEPRCVHRNCVLVEVVQAPGLEEGHQFWMHRSAMRSSRTVTL